MNNRIERIKKHFRDNKKTYIVTGVAVTVSVVTIYLLTRNHVKVQAPQIIVAPVFNNDNAIAPVFNNDSSSSVNFGGHPHKIVKCDQTGDIWETITEAAKAAEVKMPYMSRHLNGHIDHVNDKTYSIIGVGTR